MDSITAPQSPLTSLAMTLRKVLEDALVHENIERGSVEVRFDRPGQDGFTRSAINLYLYDIAENLQLREQSWQEALSDGKGSHKLGKSPIRVDLSYRVSCWTQRPEDEHDLLWMAFRAFYEVSPLSPERFTEELGQWQKKPIQLRVAQPGGSLTSLSEFWSTIGGPFRPSFNLTATLEMKLEPRASGESFDKPVLTRELVYQQSGIQLRGIVVGPDAPSRPGVAEGMEGIAGVSVQLRDAQDLPIGTMVMTDTHGRFSLQYGRISGGTYTLTAMAPDGARGKLDLRLPSMAEQAFYVRRDLSIVISKNGTTEHTASMG